MNDDIQSLEAEQSVLGAILLDASVFPDVLKYVASQSFYLRQHGEIFSSMLRIFKSNGTIDAVTLLDDLTRSGVYDEAGGRAYILELAQMVPSVANTEAYAKIVHDKCHFRNIKGKAQEALLYATDAGFLVEELRKISEDNALASDDGASQISVFSRYQEELWKPFDPDSRIWTGIKAIDNKTNGLIKQLFSIVGATPSTGKTTLAIQIAKKQTGKVDFFSLEMASQMILDRIMSQMCHIDYGRIVRKQLSDDEKFKITEALGELAKRGKSFQIIDDVYTVEEIVSRIYSDKPDLAVVDFLQCVRTQKNFHSRREQIDYISAEFKRAAKQSGSHVMALSQVSRSMDKDNVKPRPPRMSDLKESGNLEADGDYIMMLYRPYVYTKDKEFKPSQAMVLLDKCKLGETGKIELSFDGRFQTFTEVENRYE